MLGDRHAGESGTEDDLLPLFQRTGRRQTRLTIHLDRVRDPALATPAARAELVMMLQGLVREIEQAQPAAQPHAS